MDHVPLPADPWGLRLPVPYLGGPFLYDSRGFLGYPGRVGVATRHASPNHNRLFLISHGEILPAASFIQAWLWFGLLGEAFGAGVRPNGQLVSLKPSVFLGRFGGRDVLCTEHLVPMLEKEKEKFTREGDNTVGNDDRIIGLAKSLEEARVYLHRISGDFLELRNNQVFYGLRKGDVDAVGLAIFSSAVLWQTIYNVYEVRDHPVVGVGSKSKFMSHSPPLDLVNELLDKQGWKVGEIEMMPKDVVFRYHLSFFRGKMEPKALPNPPAANAAAAYQHVKRNCACQTMTVEPPTTNNGTTLFSYNPNDAVDNNALHSQVVFLDDVDNGKPYTGTPYVAVICVQPVAEPRGRLPVAPIRTCKLEMIQKYTDKLLGAPGHFWIDPYVLSPLTDTFKLGTPPSPVQFPNVFAQASHVFVIDPWLYENTAPESSSAEKLIRLHYSNWKQSVIALLQSAQVEPNQLFFLFGFEDDEFFLFDADGDDADDDAAHDSTIASLESLLKGVRSQYDGNQTTTAPVSGPSAVTTDTPPSYPPAPVLQHPMLGLIGPQSLDNQYTTLPARVVTYPFYHVVVPSRTPTPEPYDPLPLVQPTATTTPTQQTPTNPAKTLTILRPTTYAFPGYFVKMADVLFKVRYLPRFQKDLEFLFRYLQVDNPESRFGPNPNNNPRLTKLIKTMVTMLKVAVLTLSHFRVFAEYVGTGAVLVVFRAFTQAYGVPSRNFVSPGDDIEDEAVIGIVVDRLKKMERMWWAKFGGADSAGVQGGEEEVS